MKKKFIFVFFIFLMHYNTFAQSARFLALSDIHFNPFDESKNYPIASESDKDHNDTNAFYLDAFLESATYLASHDANDQLLDNELLPKFITISGDLLTHSFVQKFSKNTDPNACNHDINACVLKTMDTVVESIRNKQGGLFTCTPIYIALGNNDSNSGNYNINKTFLSALGERFYNYIHPCNQDLFEKNQFATNFKQNNAAYAEPQVADIEGLKMLVLNTVLYTNKTAELQCKDGQQIVDCKKMREQQNAFIQSVVRENPVTLTLMHIPPFDPNSGYDMNAKPQLDKSVFSQDTFTLAGHWHYYAPLSSGIKGLMLNSVTYIKHANQNRPVPGFSILEYQANGKPGKKIQVVRHCDLKNLKDIMGGFVQPLPFVCKGS